MASEIVKRERDANWSRDEKDIFRELIAKHVEIIDDKRNDFKIVEKKKKSWCEIKHGMDSAGYRREMVKLKQQWMRMKAHVKSKLAAVRKARTATGNNVANPELEGSDEEVMQLMEHELFEDHILIDSNTDLQQFSQLQKPEPQPANEHEIEKEENDSKPQSSKNLLNKLRKLPNVDKRCVLQERQQQIKEETDQNKEYFTLKKQKLQDEIKQQKEVHELQIEQLKEIHELRKQLLIDDINKCKSDN